MSAKEWEDSILVGLIEAYLILEKEIDETYEKINEYVHNLKGYNIKLDQLNELERLNKEEDFKKN